MTDRHDVHRDSNDCTHLCYHPNVYGPWLDSIVRRIHNLLPETPPGVT